MSDLLSPRHDDKNDDDEASLDQLEGDGEAGS